jgi:flagellar motor switch protein FliG
LKLYTERKKRLDAFQTKLRGQAEQKIAQFLETLEKPETDQEDVPGSVSEQLRGWLNDPDVREDEWFELSIVARQLAVLDRNRRERILTSLPASLEQSIRPRMWSFGDLPRFENRSVQQILRKLEARTLAAALEGADERIRRTVEQNLSSRAAQVLIDEREYLGDLDERDIQAARRDIGSVIAELVDSGQISPDPTSRPSTGHG